jgi:hypothetical protein
MPKIGKPWKDDLEFDYFHLGMGKYEQRYIPDPEKKMDNWTLGNQYDCPCGWQTNQSNYKHDFMLRKKQHLEIIQGMN